MTQPVTIACKLVSPPAVEPPRCSCFDWECAHVMDHAKCHAGGTFIVGDGELAEVAPADGYCPYLTKGQTP